MTSPSRQRGWTFWSLLFVVAVIGFFALLFLKLYPPYMDNLKIKRALETVAEEPSTADATRREIIQRMERILYIDFGASIVDLNKTLRVEKIKNGRRLRVKYEVVVPLAFNISALLDFDTHADGLYFRR
jgi:hypothetical protein